MLRNLQVLNTFIRMNNYHSVRRMVYQVRYNVYSPGKPFVSCIETGRLNCSRNCEGLLRFTLIKSVSEFRTSAFFDTKIFRDTENSFAHKVMEEKSDYTGTLLITRQTMEPMDPNEIQGLLCKDWNVDTPENLFKAFKRISCNSENNFPMSHELFDNICHSLTVKCKEMDDSQLIGTIGCLIEWPLTESVESRNFSSLWRALDKECVNRCRQWDRNELLYVSDHWYKLHLARVSEYMWHSNWRLGRRATSLTPSQLVQTMFYMNACRKIHPGLSMYEFEFSFERCIDNLTLNEIGIMSMGFFKTQTKIRSSNLLYKILERTIGEIDTIEDITLGAILKVVRSSLPITLVDMLYDLLNKLVSHIERVSILCCVQIALAGTNVLVFHEDILKAISERFTREIKNVRVKDLERLAFVLTLFNYDPCTKPCIFRSIISELGNSERKEEFKTYKKCVPRCLYFLTIKRIILDDHITRVLDPEFIRDVYGKNQFHIDREVLCLDATLEIERPQYTGNKLTSKMRNFLAKKYMMPLPRQKKKMTASHKLFLGILEELDLILGGEQYYYAGQILPHFENPDIVFFISSDEEAIKIAAMYHNAEAGAVKYPPSLPESGCWCGIVVGGWNTYINNTKKMLGSTASKIRHLKIIGYSPIFIPWHEWIDLPACGRKDYIRSKIEAACARPEETNSLLH